MVCVFVCVLQHSKSILWCYLGSLANDVNTLEKEKDTQEDTNVTVRNGLIIAGAVTVVALFLSLVYGFFQLFFGVFWFCFVLF